MGSSEWESSGERIVEKDMERCEGFVVERRVRLSLLEIEVMEDDAIEL